MARILVIDDEPDMRKMLAQMLASAGHEVVLAADGREGIMRYSAKRADLVITDLIMPNQEGVETIIQLRKEFPDVIIIAMSGKTTGRSMLAATRKLGAAAILEKPFTSDHLLATVEKAMRSESEQA